MTTPFTFTFTDENENDCKLVRVIVQQRKLGSIQGLDATLSDVTRAVEAQGYRLVEADRNIAFYSDQALAASAQLEQLTARVGELEHREKVTGVLALERQLIETGRRVTVALQRAETAERERDEARAELERIKRINREHCRDYNALLRENVKLCDSLEKQRAVVEAVDRLLPDYESLIDCFADRVGETDGELIKSRALAAHLRNAITLAKTIGKGGPVETKKPRAETGPPEPNSPGCAIASAGSEPKKETEQ